MDADGVRDPQDVYDAAGAAMVYLCDGGRDLSTQEGLTAAVLAYNHSRVYLRQVLAWKTAFDGADLMGVTDQPAFGAWALPPDPVESEAPAAAAGPGRSSSDTGAQAAPRPGRDAGGTAGSTSGGTTHRPGATTSPGPAAPDPSGSPAPTPATDPGKDPGKDPGTEPGKDPGKVPGKDSGPDTPASQAPAPTTGPTTDPTPDPTPGACVTVPATPTDEAGDPVTDVTPGVDAEADPAAGVGEDELPTCCVLVDGTVVEVTPDDVLAPGEEADPEDLPELCLSLAEPALPETTPVSP
jgi:hypothetical protein